MDAQEGLLFPFLSMWPHIVPFTMAALQFAFPAEDTAVTIRSPPAPPGPL